MAVLPCEEARSHLRKRLPSGVRYTAPEKWHITLAFLGDVPADRFGEVTRALDEVPPPADLTLHLAEGGNFRDAVWAGVAGDVPALATFRTGIHTALSEAGFPLDERPFTPHLTVSYRFSRPLLRSLQGYTGPSWPVTSFTLLHSEAGVHVPIAGYGPVTA
ncbi:MULTISPECIES: RNA 2',3'-cyclic phosphodiesterase [Actinoplanes]|uniref:RNA 2',3'-cyclic phosphodiesterase n=1 Tax=Actinoplanes TaxID=1865 RepID=UPI0006982420|nr:MULTISPECIES: RNA 2',3'-cyclic phosphodiesterase [Actinoplanes]GLY05932.1 RNA 2',3'-cyclic phosphodiesterase [Actinoplanes sp. NBRC 101535]